MIELGSSFYSLLKHPVVERFYERKRVEKARRAEASLRLEANTSELAEELGAMAFAIDLTSEELAYQITKNPDFPWIYTLAMKNTIGWEEASAEYDGVRQKIDDEMEQILDFMRLASQKIYPGYKAQRIKRKHTWEPRKRRKNKVTKEYLHTDEGRLLVKEELAKKEAREGRYRTSDEVKEQKINMRPAHMSDLEENPFDRDLGYEPKR